MKRFLLGILLVLGLTGIACGDEVYLTRTALRSSIKIASWMDSKNAKPVYRLALHLEQGERVIVNGCMEVTNDAGDNVGWCVELKEMTTDSRISPRQCRNVTPPMHHDSLGVVGYFEAPADGDYVFALLTWNGSTTVAGRYLTIDTALFGQVMITILD
jgi:hypothetical protein